MKANGGAAEDLSASLARGEEQSTEQQTAGLRALNGAAEDPMTASIERMSQRVKKSTYQGLRHLMPGNLSPLRALITRGQARNQLESLKEMNRVSPLQPPLVHRPDSRYVKNVLVKSESGK